MENIIGHEKVKANLQKLIQEDKVGHAYLFYGREGIGKKLMAIAFAKQLMSQQDGVFHEGDFQMIAPQNDVIKVEEIRDFIHEVYLKPVYSQRKVFIIDDADKMNANAQNALLKVLEEPPLYVTIILVVSNKEKIIKTILSRVTEITFDKLSDEELSQIVGQKMDFTLARGSAKKALSMISEETFQATEEIQKWMDEKNFLALNKKFSEIKKEEMDIEKILETLKMLYHKNMKEDTYAKVKKIEWIEETIKNLNRNANTDLAIDKLMLQICEDDR